MNITLFQPPVFAAYKVPSLVLAQLAAVLKQDSHEISCIDSKLLYDKFEKLDREQTVKNLVKKIEKTKPEMLSVSAMAPNLATSVEIIKLFKKRNPDVKVVVGGYPATFSSEELLGIAPEIDFLVRGENEIDFVNLVKTEKKQQAKSISFVKNGKVVHNPQGKDVIDVNKMPFPDYSDFGNLKDITVFQLLPTRGCPYRCKFCSVYKMHCPYRIKKIDYIQKELNNLYDQHQFLQLDIIGAEFGAHLKFAKDFSKMMGKEKIALWRTMARVELPVSVARTMALNGCIWLDVGVESIVPSTLKFLNKTNNPVGYVKSAKKLLVGARKHMDVCYYMMTGIPVESKEDMEKNVAFKQGMDKELVDGSFSVLAAYPGTDYWNMYKSGELELMKIKSKKICSTDTDFYADKYSDKPWFTPNKYMFKSKVMKQADFEDIVGKQLSSR